MRTFALGDVLASRTLQFQPGDGPATEVVVKVGKPVPDLENADRAWICPFQIRGIRDEPVRRIFGVDALQALVLALHALPTVLRSIAREESGSFPNGDEDLGLTAACKMNLGADD